MKEKMLARAALLCALLASGTFQWVAGRLHAQTPAAVSPSDYPGTASAAVEEKHALGGFFPRLGRAYAEDWNGTAPETPEAPRRGFPAPLSSPPFPFSDWPYGGSPVIGATDTAGSPLLTAIYGGKDGEWWERKRIKIYGWINGGFNCSTSDKHYGNALAAYRITSPQIRCSWTRQRHTCSASRRYRTITSTGAFE
jgi:hypothetical protein